MTPGKNKAADDIENLCPVKRKRSSTSVSGPPTKLDSKSGYPLNAEILEDLGLGALKSEECLREQSDEDKTTQKSKLDAVDKLHNRASFETTPSTSAAAAAYLRSPLAKMDTNSQQRTSLSLTASRQGLILQQQLRKIKPGQLTLQMCNRPSDAFFLYRDKRVLGGDGTNPFAELPDELMLEVFNFLPRKTLSRISMVNAQFCRCALDCTLWQRLDMSGRPLRAEALQHILERRVRILRLSKAKILEPIFSTGFSTSGFKARLLYLDLSYAAVSPASLALLFTVCGNLKRLSLELLTLDLRVCSALAKCADLEVLNLAMCTGLDGNCVRALLPPLKKLVSLNIAWTDLTENAVQEVVSSITPNIMRLNISGCRKVLTDKHLVTLMRRCKELVELDLSDCTGLTAAAVSIIGKSRLLEYLSISRCYQISASVLLNLTEMESLKYLDVFGLISTTALEYVADALPNLQLNQFCYSCVARPTVGSARCSIWGLPTQDHGITSSASNANATGH